MEQSDRKQWNQITEYEDYIFSSCDRLLKEERNPYYWAHSQLNVDLYDNQSEIIKAILDPKINNIAIMQARGAGKTYAVCVGLLKLCTDYTEIKIGIFAPKSDLATRLIEEITEHIATADKSIYYSIDWKRSTKSRLFFMNGSEMTAMSAAPTTQQEGWHFHVIVLDECHRIEDAVVNQRISPMLGSYTIAKTIKIGIPAAKNNFWRSCVASRDYLVLKRNWLECPILLKPGSFFYNGVEYPEHIVRKLSLTVKQKLFPDRPDLHYEGDYSEYEYKTQFAMEWVSDIFLELDEKNQSRLVSGKHEILPAGRPTLNEEYFFGLDTAPGSLMPGKKDLDFTALSIWRKRGDNIKEKVACFEWQGDITTQWDEIKVIIHPVTGIFKCKFGLADFSNIAQGIIPFFQKEKIPIDGILFGRSESESGKNNKNAMFDEFRFELESGRVKFPSLDTVDKDKIFKKSFNEWCNIERHHKTGINDQIEAPPDLHDDHCCADILAVWAMDKMNQFKVARSIAYKLPRLQVGAVSSVQSRLSGNQKEENRYLK